MRVLRRGFAGIGVLVGALGAAAATPIFATFLFAALGTAVAVGLGVLRAMRRRRIA